MDSGKQFTRIGDLASGIATDVRRMEKGELPVADLEKLADNASELHERLIVLRHKAREASPSRPVEGKTEQATPPAATINAPVPPATIPTSPVVHEPPAIRLDTAPKQTSLIDAIAETEVRPTKVKPPKLPEPTPKSELPQATEPAPAAPTPKAAKPVASVGEKLGRAPITDLGKAVALSQKFWFVAELFAGDRNAYERAIAELNKAPGRAEALAYVKDEVTGKLKNPPGEDVLAAFVELIERRHR